MKEVDYLAKIANLRHDFLKLKRMWDLSLLIAVEEWNLKLFALNPFYTAHYLIKKNGNKRLIEQPEKGLKKIQQKLNNYLQAVYFYTKPDSVYGFARSYGNTANSRNIITQARRHTGKECVIRIDLQDFFHSINAARVRDMFMEKPFSFPKPLSTLLALLTTYYDHLPMGAPTSPILSNFIFLKTDIILKELSDESGLTYTRYADDLIFSGAYPGEQFIPCVAKIIEQQGFKVNPEKTMVQRKSFRQVATGIKVNQKPNLDRRYIRRIRAILHDWQVNGMETAAINYYDENKYKSPGYNFNFPESLMGRIEFVGFVRGKGDAIYKRLIEKYRHLQAVNC